MQRVKLYRSILSFRACWQIRFGSIFRCVDAVIRSAFEANIVIFVRKTGESQRRHDGKAAQMEFVYRLLYHKAVYFPCRSYMEYIDMKYVAMR